MKFFYSLLIYIISIIITLSIITLFVSGQSHYNELKLYTYSQGKFIVHYPSNYTVDSQESQLNTEKPTFPLAKEL
jgi:hypothetical protein